MANRIKKCIIGCKYTDEISELNAFGIETVPLPLNPYLDNEICNHADILCFNTGDGTLFADLNVIGDIRADLKHYKLVACDLIKSPYPNDVKLNIAVLGDKLICNTKTTSPEILNWAKTNGFRIINVNQGYSKCNICIVNDNAIITEDSGIASLLKNYQIDVLKLQSGYVALSKEHYGFIGGAAMKISDNEIYFSGDISSHPEFNIIEKFLTKYGFKPIYNKNRILRDFGGFIPVN